jgi:hypothetical protein
VALRFDPFLEEFGGEYPPASYLGRGHLAIVRQAAHGFGAALGKRGGFGEVQRAHDLLSSSSHSVAQAKFSMISRARFACAAAHTLHTVRVEVLPLG